MVTKAKKHVRLGRFVDAIQVCQLILDAEQNHPEALALSGLASVQTGSYETGVALLRRAFRNNTTNIDAMVALGVILAQNALNEEADQVFHKALAIEPVHIKANLNYAALLERQGRFVEAGPKYQTVTGQAPQMASAWLGLGNTQRASGNLDSAVVSYQHAIEADPDFVSAYHNLGGGVSGVAALF